MWKAVFGESCHVYGLDINPKCKAFQDKVTTITPVFPKLNPGGYIAIEDIHGAHYLQTFFQPTAQFLAVQAQSGQLASIHVYPFVLMAKKAGQPTHLPATELTF